jgi:hypothetical protein
MMVIVPLSLLGQTASAILHSQGGVWVNGYEARDSSAVFSGDILETRPGFSANLSLEGSAALIQPESVTKFQGDLLELDHGGVAVETSRSFKVRVHCITVTPVSNEWTKYEVANVNGSVEVAARKSDVNVEIEMGHRKPAGSAASQGGTVHEGEQHSYDESELCGAPGRLTSAASALNPKWIAIGAGAIGSGILICVVLLCPSSGKSPPPLSASRP